MPRGENGANLITIVGQWLSSSLVTAIVAGLVAAGSSYLIQKSDHSFQASQWYTQSLNSEKFTDFREMVTEDLDLTATAISVGPEDCDRSSDPPRCIMAKNHAPKWDEYSRAVTEFGDSSITQAWIDVRRNVKRFGSEPHADIDAFILLAYFQAVLKSTYLGQSISAEQVIQSYFDPDVWEHRQGEVRQHMKDMGLPTH